MGTRAHDPYPVHLRAEAAGRLVMGKLIFDAMRGIDFLLEREDIDPDRIGVAGNSLGGAVAGWVAALEPRIDTAIVCGWAFEDIALRTKFCTSAPNQRMREICSWSDFLRLMSPVHVVVMNGDADVVIDREGDGSAWEGMRRAQRELPVHRGELALWFEKDGGHRPYFAHPRALRWIHRHLGFPDLAHDHLFSKGPINGGVYCDQHKIPLEKLYGTALHQRGSLLAGPPDGKPIRPLPREKLAVLKPEEIGRPEFNIEGWLDAIEKNGPSPESD